MTKSFDSENLFNILRFWRSLQEEMNKRLFKMKAKYNWITEFSSSYS